MATPLLVPAWPRRQSWPGRLVPSEYRRRLQCRCLGLRSALSAIEVESYNAGVPADDSSSLSQILLTKSATVSGKGLQWRTICRFTSDFFLVYAETNCSRRHARGVVAIRAHSHEERLCALLELPGRGGDPYGVGRDLRRM